MEDREATKAEVAELIYVGMFPHAPVEAIKAHGALVPDGHLGSGFTIDEVVAMAKSPDGQLVLRDWLKSVANLPVEGN